MAKLLFDDYDFQKKWVRVLTHPILLSFFNSLLIIILIIFGIIIAARDSNVFVGLIGDGWGEVAVIEEIRTGRIYPFSDPANAEITEPLLHQPPLFFWTCLLIGEAFNLTSFWTQHIMNIISQFLFHYAFYMLCLALFNNKKQARLALLFSVFAYSLSWIRLVGILFNWGTVQAGITSILTGNTNLNVDPSVREKINFVMYEYWDLRHNLFTQRNSKLSYSFGFLSLLFYKKTEKITDWKPLGISAAFFGLAIMTHHLSTLGFSAIFFILFLIRLIRDKKISIEFLILLIGHLIGSFVTIPVFLNLFGGGATRWILESQTTDPGWGLRTPSGRPSWPYPWETFEAYGLVFLLAMLGVYWLHKKGSLDKFGIPAVMGFWGMIIGNLQWVGIEYQVLLRQTNFLFYAFFIYAPFALEYIFLKLDSFSANRSKMRTFDKLKKLKLTRFQARILFILILLIGLFTSQLVGFFIFNLRKTPVHFIVDGDEYEGIMWLAENTENSQVVYAPEDVSRKIPALSGNNVALGYVSYYSLTREDVRALRINESYIVFGKGNYQESEEIIKKYNSSYLFVVLDELTDDKLSFFDVKFEKAFENDDIMIFRVP